MCNVFHNATGNDWNKPIHVMFSSMPQVLKDKTTNCEVWHIHTGQYKFGLSWHVIIRFCDLVNSITEEAWRGPDEGDCDTDALEVRYSTLVLHTG